VKSSIIPSEGENTQLLIDTHVLVWLAFGEPMLGPRARKAIKRAALDQQVRVSAITPWEIAVLVSKGRIDLHQDTLQWTQSALRLPGVKLTDLSPEIAVASTRLPWEMHGDPADRILVATARHFGATLVTADRQLLEYARLGYFRGLSASL
jgi:PIN domain nuclease of toxin-antitoxin system